MRTITVTMSVTLDGSSRAWAGPTRTPGAASPAAAGTRLFADDGPFTEFELARSVPTTTGVIIAEYRRA